MINITFKSFRKVFQFKMQKTFQTSLLKMILKTYTVREGK